MNCVEVAEILDRMIFEEVLTDAEIGKHMAGCAACRQVYSDTLKAREIMNFVRRSEPALRNPEENINAVMAAIMQRPGKSPVVFPLIQRFLAAASVACFLLLGYEQYQVVKKVSALEMQFSGTRQVSRYANSHRLAPTLDYNKAGISFSEIERLLSSVKGKTPISSYFIKKRLEQSKIK